MNDIFRYLAARTYPGRGIIAGSSRQGTVLAYFLMGRSGQSRNRVLRKDGDRVYIEPFDTSREDSPSVYNAVRRCGGDIIVGNGSLTDAVAEALNAGGSFEQALAERSCKQDAPVFTPRIAAVLHADGSCDMAILRKSGDGCNRSVYHLKAEPGKAWFLPTYEDDDPLRAYAGDPIAFDVDPDIDDLAGSLWDSLDEDNRVSLYVRYDGPDGAEDLIFNANGG